LFCAPADETDPARRILAVLKWFLSSLKGQQYAGRDPSQGIKKPLNAFLGEIFIGDCGPEDDQTKMVAEQVSHHPPVTACYLWNDRHGVRAEGYTRQEITFSGTVNIQQIGHAILTIDKYDENYLIPLPNVKVSGILSGSPYPELVGSHTIVSSSGYLAHVDFSGKRFLGLGGQKNHLHAEVRQVTGNDSGEAIYVAEGSWSEGFEIKDSSGQVIDKHDVGSAQATAFQTPALEKQDAWESRKAWDGVIKSIQSGSMQGVADHKNKLENAQRAMRKKPETSEAAWKPLFFRKDTGHALAEGLLGKVGQKLEADKTEGCWRFDADAAARHQRPWRGELTPFG